MSRLVATRLLRRRVVCLARPQFPDILQRVLIAFDESGAEGRQRARLAAASGLPGSLAMKYPVRSTSGSGSMAQAETQTRR